MYELNCGAEAVLNHLLSNEAWLSEPKMVIADVSETFYFVSKASIFWFNSHLMAVPNIALKIPRKSADCRYVYVNLRVQKLWC